MKSSRLFSGLTPNIKCAFAIPKSASNNKVLFPFFANVKATFTAIVVLPTPPLPLDTATVSVIKLPFNKY